MDFLVETGFERPWEVGFFAAFLLGLGAGTHLFGRPTQFEQPMTEQPDYLRAALSVLIASMLLAECLESKYRLE